MLNDEQRMKLEDEVCDKLGLDISDIETLSDAELRRLLNPEPIEKQPKKRGRQREVHHEFKRMKNEPLIYDPETGLLMEKWTHSTDGIVSYSMQPAKTRLDRRTGYLVINRNRQQQLVHRLAWLLMTGEPAPGAVYHVNGDKTDNRWINLTDRMSREVKRYRARIRVGKGFVDLGYFYTKEEAEAAKTFFKNLQKTS